MFERFQGRGNNCIPEATLICSGDASKRTNYKDCLLYSIIRYNVFLLSGKSCVQIKPILKVLVVFFTQGALTFYIDNFRGFFDPPLS